MRDGHVLTLREADVLRDARAMAERVRRAVTDAKAATARTGAGKHP